MNREYRFRAWDMKVTQPMLDHESVLSLLMLQGRVLNGTADDKGHLDRFKIMQNTGLKDKNGKEGFFDSDVWEIKGYEYRVKWCNGYKRQECDLRFILKQGLLAVEWELINPPKDLDHITLSTIFNLKLASGKRMFVDENRQKLEIIGNIYENPELLEA